MRRFVGLVLLVGGLAVIGYLLPLHRVATDAGRLGPVVAVGTATALLLALVPRTAISLACGALFGAVSGTLYALAAAILCAAIGFALGRHLGRDFVARHARGRLSTMDEWLSRKGTLAVLVVRLIPIAPYGLVSYAYGSSGTRPRPYLAGSALGATPSAVTYAVLGSAAAQPGRFHPIVLLPAAVSLAITVTAVVRWRRVR